MILLLIKYDKKDKDKNRNRNRNRNYVMYQCIFFKILIIRNKKMCIIIN